MQFTYTKRLTYAVLKPNLLGVLFLNDIFNELPVVENGKVISPDLEDVVSQEKEIPRPAGNGMAKDDKSFYNNPSVLVKPSQLPLHNRALSNGTLSGLTNEEYISDDDNKTEFADEGEVISDEPDTSLDVDIDEKYRKLVDFFLVCGNKGKAAKLAGYDSDNPNSLRAMACRDFKRPEVRQYLKLRRAEISKKAEITFESYMSELVSIATLDIADVVETHLVRHTIENEPVYVVTFKNVSDIPEHARKAVKQIKQNKDGSTELIFYDKLQALKLLGQVKMI